MREHLLRSLPQVSRLLDHFRGKYREEYIKEGARRVLERYRKEIKAGLRHTTENLLEDVEKEIRKLSETRLKRVINATGVVINTNLGRAPLHEDVVRFVSMIASHYSNLEFDLTTGCRGSRVELVEEYLVCLTGAESAHVVNNNASAVFLILNTHAKNKEVIVSRGELVEIGGSFRIPDIMKAAGAILVEVGTTNRTRLKDYIEAITPNTAFIMKVHRSNFYMEGFVEEVKIEDLLQLSLPVYYDAGSGAVVDLRDMGLDIYEPSFRDLIKKGVHVVSGSGDKLLGGPQVGIIVGQRHLIEPLRRNPISRVVRVDKLTLSALEMTLRLYMEKRHHEIPVIRMLTVEEKELYRRAKLLARRLKRIKDLDVRIIKDFSQCGGGALPHLYLPTYCVAIKHRTMSVSQLERKLMDASTPVIVRVKRDTLLLDTRTLLPEDLEELPKIVEEAII
ncbi:L-seryl-tRNA selenium transferase [Thermocrinis albus DSM 14484]|uniref:L-seryl-tRNA(Sec) selenium transferase n=1 Tax=Thermocrinis albus (strain DSM 14484 / JCM 11386 / HI 11/12) TaxID=638303 RepID=D3SQC6_THEAH|nr:L-seryl-tRNA(Sec) selenium transferase [Thermocrinis albus]ADC89363.1 L-seryl-tRNA selenium transferase [Thermocrinis albus DSM 14484]